MKLLYAFTAVIFASTSFSQIVSTVHQGPENITDALVVDDRGFVYGSDFFGNNVYRVDDSGGIDTLISGLNTPNGLAFDSQYHLYVADLQANRVLQSDTNGNILDTFDIQSPSGIIQYHGSDTMLIAAYYTDELVKLAPDGSTEVLHTGGVLDGPVGMAYDDDGNLYVANFDGHDIYRVEEDTLVYIAQLPPNSPNNAIGFLAYGRGSLWATSLYTSRVYRISPDSTDAIHLFGGSLQGTKDGHVDTAFFNRPNGIAFDPTNEDLLYITDAGTGNLRLITFEKDTADTSLMVHSEPTASFNVYPNPCTDGIWIQDVISHSRLDIRSIQGHMIHSFYAERDQYVDLSELPSGVYILHIMNGEEVCSLKLIKNPLKRPTEW